jgi:pimeloyl-ACP methyl ester carboxylesterase
VVGGALNTRGSAGPLVAALSSSFTVIAYDRRGRGDSGDTAPYAVERELEDLVAVIRAVGGPALLLGHSSGGALALEAARGGSDVEALVVYEPPFIVDGTRPPVPDGYVQRLDELVDSGRRGDAVAYFLETGVGLPRAVVDGMRGMPMWPSLEDLAHTLGYDGRVMDDRTTGRPFRPGEWDDVAVPVLVVDGGDSYPWQRNSARALVDALPNAEHLTLDGQTHDVSPAALAPAVVEFFTR